MAAQLPDIIIIDGENHDLYSNPLEQYWMVNKINRPQFRTSGSCKRGYVATWELVDKFLVLKDIKGDYEKRFGWFWKRIRPCSLRTVLRKPFLKNPTATWFTGKIRIPKGNRIFYAHKGYESRFEQEIIITLSHGKVIKSIVLDYTHETLALAESDLF